MHDLEAALEQKNEQLTQARLAVEQSVADRVETQRQAEDVKRHLVKLAVLRGELQTLYDSIRAEQDRQRTDTPQSLHQSPSQYSVPSDEAGRAAQSVQARLAAALEQAETLRSKCVVVI